MLWMIDVRNRVCQQHCCCYCCCCWLRRRRRCIFHHQHYYFDFDWKDGFGDNHPVERIEWPPNDDCASNPTSMMMKIHHHHHHSLLFAVWYFCPCKRWIATIPHCSSFLPRLELLLQMQSQWRQSHYKLDSNPPPPTSLLLPPVRVIIKYDEASRNITNQMYSS